MNSSSTSNACRRRFSLITVSTLILAFSCLLVRSRSAISFRIFFTLRQASDEAQTSTYTIMCNAYSRYHTAAQHKRRDPDICQEVGPTMICFLFRTSLILPTQSLHCVLLQGNNNVKQRTTRISAKKLLRTWMNMLTICCC